MTCVVAVAEAGKVLIGADSAGVSGWDLRIRADRKVFTNGQFAFGFASSFRMGQLLQHTFSPSLPVGGTDLHGYMCSTFVCQVRECLKTGGYAAKHEERESGGTFIVGFRGRIFTIADDYQVEENAAPFAAVGCAEAYALGSLFATHRWGLDRCMSMHARCITALEAAETHSAGVRGPFHFVEIGE